MILSCALLLCTGCNIETKNTTTQQVILEETVAEEEIEEPVIEYPEIMIDQEGYHTISQKTAVFTGDETADSFQVVEENTDKIVYEGEFRIREGNLSSEKLLYTADFSALQEPGTYRIETKEGSFSYPFVIRELPYRTMLWEMAEEFSDRIAQCDDLVMKCHAIGTVLSALSLNQELGKEKTLQELLTDIGTELSAIGRAVDMTLLSEKELYALSGVMAQYEILHNEFELPAQEGDFSFLQAAEELFEAGTLSQTEQVVEGQIDSARFNAAAQLYRLTEKSVYHKQITQFCKNMETYDFSDQNIFIGCAAYLAVEGSVKLSVCEEMMKQLMQEVEDLSYEVRENEFLLQGEFGETQMEALLKKAERICFVNYIITNDEYEKILEKYIHFLLGNNEYGVCFIKGYGSCQMAEKGLPEYMEQNVFIRALFMGLLVEVCETQQNLSKIENQEG